MEKNILDERAASRVAQISNQPVTPSEQDVVRILLAQQQQPEVDSGRAEETNAACNAIIVTLETQKGVEGHENGKPLVLESVMANSVPVETNFQDGNMSCEDESHLRCKVEGGRKPFGTMEGLKCHVRSDTEERPHICPQQGCGKAFKAFGDLQKHKYRHTGSDGKRQRSAVWQYFIKSENVGMSQCTICSEIVKHANNTSNLFKHLKAKHREEFQQAEKQREEDQETAAKKRKTAPNPKQTTPIKLKVENAQKYPADSTRRKNVDEAVVRMVAVDMHSPSIVENVGFQSLIQLLDPRYILPSMKDLTKTLLPSIYSTKVEELKQELAQVSHLALSSELWESATTERYLTISCHFLNSSWELKSLVLETMLFTTSPSPEIIAGSLTRMLQTWGILKKIVAVVSEDASSGISAAAKGLGLTHVPSFTSVLNLVVSEAMKTDASVQELRTKCNQMVSFFHRNIKATEKLVEIQCQLGCSGQELVEEVETRWNSTYHMFQEITEQYEAITTALCLSNGNSLCLSSSDVGVLRASVAVLKPFEAATTEVSSERRVFVSKVIPLATSLEHLTSKIDTEQALALELQAQMRLHFANFRISHPLIMATMLDPRMKKLAFHDSVTPRQGELRILQELSELVPADSNQDTQTAESSAASGLWDFFDAQVAKAHSPSKGMTNAKLEVMRFFEEPVLRRNEDPLEWWKTNQSNYPLLSQLAKKYLCVPGSSVPVERLFTQKGELFSRKRNQLNSNDVDLFLFLNQNL
ncbi:E3 SUMO-protein ligase ZBED1-like isoform X2 [Acropora palmata]|uniref:E3 SUMO-protein ligase ZBED1-like isoform X2 n=1 Tax=Acropora palmata TaxID=6131 RepID=UPI003DA0A4CC